MKNKAIFFDRDGVLNDAKIIDGKPHPPDNLLHTQITYGARDTLDTLQKMGYILLVVTNQPDVADGIKSKETEQEIENFIIESLPLDDYFSCIHKREDNCKCRKPNIGMFIQANEKYNIDFSRSWIVGDRWSDIKAGQNMGMKTIFIDHKYKEQKPYCPDFIVQDIGDIKEIIYAN